MKTLTQIIAILMLGGCGDAGAVDAGGFGGTGGTGGTEDGGGLIAECDFESCQTAEDGTERCLYWAEFPVDPGKTEYTVCSVWNDTYIENYPGHPYAQNTCWRGVASYYEGTSTGFVTCQDNTRSITVHR